jgi:hypothetical protein
MGDKIENIAPSVQGFLAGGSVCPNCGGAIVGDGHTGVRHCENYDGDRIWDSEPDAPVILCKEERK